MHFVFVGDVVFEMLDPRARIERPRTSADCRRFHIAMEPMSPSMTTAVPHRVLRALWQIGAGRVLAPPSESSLAPPPWADVTFAPRDWLLCYPLCLTLLLALSCNADSLGGPIVPGWK